MSNNELKPILYEHLDILFKKLDELEKELNTTIEGSNNDK